MLFCQRTHKTHSSYHLVAVELPFIPKVSDCMHQTVKTYLEREHNILLSVTHKLYVYQVCHGVGRCVKDESYINYFNTTKNNILFIDVSASRRKPSSGLTSSAGRQYVKACPLRGSAGSSPRLDSCCRSS